MNELDIHSRLQLATYANSSLFIGSKIKCLFFFFFYYRDDLSRHHYYLQLRDNVLARGQASIYSSDELLLLLAGYALQADFGDFEETKHFSGYFPLEHYLPRDLVARSSHAAATITTLHKENAGMTVSQAEIQYIQ